MNFTLTEHARLEMIRRQIPLVLLRKLMKEPQQVVLHWATGISTSRKCPSSIVRHICYVQW